MKMMAKVVAVCVLMVLTGGAVRAQSRGTVAGPAASTVARGDESGQVQVCVETRIMTIEKKLLPPEIYDPAAKQWRSGFLDDRQVEALVRSALPDQEGTLVTAPRVTVFDGGEASVDVSTNHQYRDVKAATRPDGSQEYSPTLSDTWDGIRENITAKTDAGHQVASIKLQLAIQKLLGMEKVQTKPTHTKDKPIEFELPQLQTVHIDTSITVPNGKTALAGGQILGSEGAQERAMVVLVMPSIIIGNSRTGVILPSATSAAAR